MTVLCVGIYFVAGLIAGGIFKSYAESAGEKDADKIAILAIFLWLPILILGFSTAMADRFIIPKGKG